MGWHSDPEDKAAWSTAGGAVMAAGAGGAIAWLAIAEPSTSHEPLWPVFAFGVIAVVGLYGMLAPLLYWCPWNDKPPSKPPGGSPPDSPGGGPKERIGYRGREGSTGRFRGTRFGSGLDTAIDNEGDISVEDSDVD